MVHGDSRRPTSRARPSPALPRVALSLSHLINVSLALRALGLGCFALLCGAVALTALALRVSQHPRPKGGVHSRSLDIHTLTHTWARALAFLLNPGRSESGERPKGHPAPLTLQRRCGARNLHQALGYRCKKYGISEAILPVLVTGISTSLQKLNKMTKFSIFQKSSTSSKFKKFY